MSRQLSLYPEEQPEPGFIIDTMVLIGIGRLIYPPEVKDSARQIVDKLVAKRRIISSVEVYNEVNYKHKKGDGDEVCGIAENYKNQDVFLKITEEDQENVALILQEFPTFLKADGERPDADPWLVALAIRHKFWTVVTRDGMKNTPGLQKMKQVCDHFDIPSITDTMFYQIHGWTI